MEGRARGSWTTWNRAWERGGQWPEGSQGEPDLCDGAGRYIGLPAAGIFATNGFQVLGVDINPRVVETVNAGNIHIDEPGLRTLVRAAIGSGNLRASLQPEPCDAYIIAAPRARPRATSRI